MTEFFVSQSYEDRNCWLDKSEPTDEYDVQCDDGWLENPAGIMLKFNNKEVSTPAGSYTLTVTLAGEEDKPLVTTFLYPGDLDLNPVPVVNSFWDPSMSCGELLVELDGGLDVKTNSLRLLIDPYYSDKNIWTPGLFVNVTKEQYQDIDANGYRIRINGALVNDIAEHYLSLLSTGNPDGVNVESQTRAYNEDYNYARGYTYNFVDTWAACPTP